MKVLQVKFINSEANLSALTSAVIIIKVICVEVSEYRSLISRTNGETLNRAQLLITEIKTSASNAR